MKILYIIPSLGNGGAEKLIVDICNELSKNTNLVVRLVIFDNIPPSFNHLGFIKKADCSFHLSIFNKNRINIDTLKAEIESFQPTIIHSHLFLADIISRSCSYPKARWFSHFHDNMPQFANFSFKTFFSKTAITNFWEKRYLFQRYAANGGNHFITISNDTHDYALKTCGNYPVTLLHNAIDVNRYKRTVPFNFDKIRIVNIGSFVPKKNQSFFIAIAEALLKITNCFEIVLLGNGETQNAIVEKIKEKKLSQYFVLPGAVTNVEAYLNEANLYVHTANYEPFGLVLLEAMAAGLPVITLDGKGNRDIIEDGKNGFIYFEENGALFAEKIVELWRDKEKHKRISDYAQTYAEAFDLKRYTQRLLEIYNGL